MSMEHWGHYAIDIEGTPAQIIAQLQRLPPDVTLYYIMPRMTKGPYTAGDLKDKLVFRTEEAAHG